MALDTMRDIEFYPGRFPSRKTQIAKHRHVQFHVEAFFHELYILFERRDFLRMRTAAIGLREDSTVLDLSSYSE